MQDDLARRYNCNLNSESMGLDHLLAEVRACTYCAAYLPLGANPVLRAHGDARIVVIGQAPGLKVHATGTPWNDPSGDRLRAWLGVDRAIFYDERIFAIMSMGFCYPGKAAVKAGRSYDNPPRPECAPLWHAKIRSQLGEARLHLLVGMHSLRYYLPGRPGLSVAAAVQASDPGRDTFVPLVHPSPRNQMWFRENAWFERDFLPQLRRRVRREING